MLNISILLSYISLYLWEIILFSQPQPIKKIPEPIKTSKDVETRQQTVHITLIRDQNGLGFSISGGKGSPPYKDNSDVRDYLITIQFIARIITIF